MFLVFIYVFTDLGFSVFSSNLIYFFIVLWVYLFRYLHICFLFCFY